MPNGPGQTLTLPARLVRLADAVAFVDAFCRREGIARTDSLRLTLAVEELFTNTVTHGHGSDCDAPIRLTLRADSARLLLDYADSAPPFDPQEGLASTAGALDADVGERPVGGLGLALVAGLADDMRHAYADGGNRLQLILRRQG
ncbi:MAG: ATP-binding protein [Rubrivivax sp.]|nr:ATP-binding protein [Rubrivivax sp.]MDH5338168.1 ATP-binding protein [Rubrivivax sp.]